MITSLKGCKTFYFCFSLKQGFASIAEALLENNSIRSLYLKLVTHNLAALMWFILNVQMILWTQPMMTNCVWLLTNYWCVMFNFSSGNYGGPLGASSLAQGILGNKSLRVLFKTLDYILPVPHSFIFFNKFLNVWKWTRFHSISAYISNYGELSVLAFWRG